MASSSTSYLRWLTLVMVVMATVELGLSQVGHRDMDNPTEHTFYPNAKGIQEFTGPNFTSTVTGSNTAWAVQFYNSWCGGCQRFVPTWKALTEDIKAWRHMIKLAAVPCSHPQNIQSCRIYDVYSYPTIKYFPPSCAVDFRGLWYECPLTLAGLRMCVVDFLQGVIHKPLSWPRLEPIRSLSEIRRSVHHKKNDQDIYVIFEDPLTNNTEHNYLAREVILDVSPYDKYMVVRMHKYHAVNFGVTQFPSLYKLNEDDSITQIVVGVSRRAFAAAIRGISPSSGGTVTHVYTTPSSSKNKKPVIPDGVHAQDLESSLYYTLFHEVAQRSNISGKALTALQEYVQVLAKLLPVKGNVHNWLERVSKWLCGIQGSLSGEVLEQKLIELETHSSYLPHRVIWTGCLGSEPRLRGYTCSMWTTLHTLSVAAYTKNATSPVSGRDVLLKSREYIRHFFSCRECRNHYIQGAKTMENDVTDNESAVMWLWRRHNAVNKRLSGDVTDDPRHPKMQFPSQEACPECAAWGASGSGGIKWRSLKVLRYLISFYGPDHIIQDTVPYTHHTEVIYGSKGSSARVNLAFVSSLICLVFAVISHLRW